MTRYLTTALSFVALGAIAAAGVALAPLPRHPPGAASPASSTLSLTWTANRHGQYTWDGAVAAAGAYADEGFDDWRLPTITEAQDAMLDGSYGATEAINGTITQYTSKSQGQWNTTVRATTDAFGVPIPGTVTTKKVLKGSILFCKFVRP